MNLTSMRRACLNRLRTAAVVFAVVFLNVAVWSDELHVVDDLENAHRDFNDVLAELNIPIERFRELLADVYVTTRQKDVLDAAVANVTKLNNLELRKMDPRFMDGVSSAELLDFLLEFGENQPRLRTRDQDRDARKDIEELTTYGYSFGHISEDPAEFSVEDIRYMRSIRESANRLYRERRYEKAYPLLLDLAKRGFRDAQSRLAYILFNGAGDVQKSNMRALGWLGAASAPPTEPGFRVLFNRYMRQVPEAALPRVEAVVNGYREQYSHSEYQVCSTEHPHALHHGSSIVKRTYCRFRIEAIADACFPYRCWVHGKNTEPGEIMGLQPIEEKLQELLHMERLEELL